MCRCRMGTITTCSWWMESRRLIRARKERREIIAAKKFLSSRSVKRRVAARGLRALLREKTLQERPAFLLAHSAHDLATMIQGRKLKQVHHAAGGTGLGKKKKK